MSLAAGTTLGAYEVIGALGAGGMGEVYRARDTRLNREVAIKVLPELLAGDANHLARLHAKHRCWGRSITRTSRRSMPSKSCRPQLQDT